MAVLNDYELGYFPPCPKDSLFSSVSFHSRHIPQTQSCMPGKIVNTYKKMYQRASEYSIPLVLTTFLKVRISHFIWIL